MRQALAAEASFDLFFELRWLIIHSFLAEPRRVLCYLRLKSDLFQAAGEEGTKKLCMSKFIIIKDSLALESETSKMQVYSNPYVQLDPVLWRLRCAEDWKKMTNQGQESVHLALQFSHSGHNLTTTPSFVAWRSAMQVFEKKSRTNVNRPSSVAVAQTAETSLEIETALKPNQTWHHQNLLLQSI